MSVNLLPILFKRQIPDHIKSAYPLFVDFLKAYQEFLSQTQSQELEKFRDIDTVTEEFVERFKAELAYNVPLDDLQDKRMFLKNLREFYLSRGSEASYKFIFKTFFNKDVEIFYPSRQMLRVSDGKWKQDVSIFVQNTSSTASSLFPLNGNYISIDSGGKRLTSYVENVVQYSNNIFEVFIQRDIVKSIVVGATISYTEDGITYSGNTLLTPRSIKVLRPGNGFKVGDIFNLRTNTGEGCKIKVTQVDGNGGIVRAKILKFSLDYSSNFWSYLNAKDGAVTVPQSYTEIPDPADPSGENKIQTLTLSDITSNNIIESGFISRQNYMFYDTNIQTGSETQGANRFFADTTYVGQVDSQIYADNLIDYNPEDLALIEVQVGACSIYSGYYLAQDGFISDEIYIQDSNYYQAFSYVIKVEEELRKYADLVKTILHPAGMKMFAEFQIYNNINISATSIFKNRVIQISDSFTTFNQGIAYSDYDVTYDVNNVFVHTPKAGASIILTPFNTLAYILGKRVYSPTTTSTVDVIKFVIKPISVSYSIDEIYPVKLVEKPFDETSLIESNATKLVEKPFDEAQSIESTNIKLVEKPFTETPAIGSSNVKLVEKPFNESYVANSNATKLVEKPFNEAQSIQSSNVKLVEKPFTETPAIGSSNVKLVEKPFTETPAIGSSNTKLVEKPFTETPAIGSSNTKLVEKPFDEVQPIGSIANKNLDKALINETLNISSISTKLFDKDIGSSIYNVASVVNKNFLKSLSSPTSISSIVSEKKFEKSFPTESISLVTTEFLVAYLIELDESFYNVSTTSTDVGAGKGLTSVYATQSSLLPMSSIKALTTNITIQDPLSRNLSTTQISDSFSFTEEFNYFNGLIRDFTSSISLTSLLLESTTIKQISSPYSFNSVPVLDIQRQLINSSYSVVDTPIISPGLIINESLLPASNISAKDSNKTVSSSYLATDIPSIGYLIGTINLSYSIGETITASVLIPFTEAVSIASSNNNLYDKILPQLSISTSSLVAKTIEKSTISSQYVMGENINKVFDKSLSESTTISDVDYVLSAIKELSSQVSLASAINNKDAAKTLPQLTITASSVITSKEKNNSVTSGVSTDDSGSLKLNSYDLGDYFYPNAIDYQSDIISIT